MLNPKIVKVGQRFQCKIGDGSIADMEIKKISFYKGTVECKKFEFKWLNGIYRTNDPNHLDSAGENWFRSEVIKQINQCEWCHNGY